MLRLTTVLLLALAVLLVLPGCSGPCPKVTQHDTSVTPPGLVQLLFSVTCNGEPVTSLASGDVSLTEGGRAASNAEAEWRLDPVTAALETYTLLLIDVSASIIEEGTLATAQEVATDFSRSLVAQGQQVGVSIFDGDPEIRTVIDFTIDADAIADAIAGISAADQLDPSTNLNGAVVSALEVLDGIVNPSVEAELVSVANLVVFTDGADRAGRVTHDRAVRTINGSDHDVFVVALVEDEDVEELEELGDDGFFRTSDVATLTDTFDELIARLVAEVNKYYRVSYCSPLRSPRTTLKMTLTWEDSKASTSVSYPTKDFGPGCALPERSP